MIITVVNQLPDDQLDHVDYSYDATYELENMVSESGDPLEQLIAQEEDPEIADAMNNHGQRGELWIS